MDQTPFAGTSPGPSQQRGASTSSRTVVIIVIAAVVFAFVLILALPVVIFLIKFCWPRIRGDFDRGLKDLEQGAKGAWQAVGYLWMHTRALLR